MMLNRLKRRIFIGTKMGKVSIKLHTTEGVQKEKTYPCNIRRISIVRGTFESADLSAISTCNNLEQLDLAWTGLENIDLSPLRGCSQLNKLSLGENKLKAIDLGPLSSCTGLEKLYLDENRLSKLDLTPLSSCKKLKKLWLDNNQLRRINLSPLALCEELTHITLSENKLENVDLLPLSNCSKLEVIGLDGNPLQNVELSPLANIAGLEHITLRKTRLGIVQQYPAGVTLLSRDTVENEIGVPSFLQSYIRIYDIPLNIHSIDLIKWLTSNVQKYEPETWKIMHLVQCLVQAVCPDGIGFVDIGTSTFVRILNKTNPQGMREDLIDAFCRQIDRGGTTVGTDVELLKKTSSPELAARIPRIIELRKDEMEWLSANIKDMRKSYNIDLRPIWLTAYGYRILESLGFGLECSQQEFRQILVAFKEIGFPLEEQSHSSIHLSISDTLSEYIFTLVNYRRWVREEIERRTR